MKPDNEIVVYQPDETIRIDVRLENETVWLTQAQLCNLFQRDVSVISRHIKNIFKEGELDEGGNLHFLQIANSDKPVALYSLDVIISVGYRVKSIAGTRFRQWANNVLRTYLLRGYAVNERLERIERKVMKHDEQINLVLKTSLPPVQGIFYDGQIWDARVFAERLFASARSSIVVIDNWATVETLDILAKKRKGVSATIFTSEHRGKDGLPRHKLSASDISAFNKQYPSLFLRFCETFHDRFIIIDDKDLYLIGASLKDLGRKCFGFTKMDSSEITRLKTTAFASSAPAYKANPV